MSQITRALVVRQLLGSRFGFLFVALVLSLGIPPLLPQGPLVSILMPAFLAAILISGLYSVSKKRKQLVFGLALVIPALIFSWSVRLYPADSFEIAGFALTGTFFLYLAWLILLFILSAPRVDVNIIFAAICIYLLLGFACAMGFSIAETVSPGAIAYPDRLADFASDGRAIYFSFVTLTTLGYGDMSPVSGPARGLAIMEAVTGQLILVVLIARLVAMYTLHATNEDSDPEVVE